MKNISAMLIIFIALDALMQKYSAKIEYLLQKDSELSSLPEIYIRVSELMENENSTSEQIGGVVETDPALTARILKMVNSAFYGFPKEITTISQSIFILGRDRLRQILIGTMLGGVFGNMNNRVFSMNDYWYESVKTAILARQLCSLSDIKFRSETLFTAGLLHKIGRLIMVERMPNESLLVQNAIDVDDANIFEAERRIFGFTHCELGAAFISKWGLPQILSEIARHYEDPEQAEEFNQEARFIHLASHLTFLVSTLEVEEVEYALEDIPGWQMSGLYSEQITEACIFAEEQVYEVMDSLGMGTLRIEDDD
jgi:HD-like signal output (HDOD) protein